MRTSTTIRSIAGAIFSFALCATAVAQTPGFEPLPILTGYVSGVPMGISGDGSVVLGTSVDGPGNAITGVAMIWKDGVAIKLLPDVADTYGHAMASSFDGSVIVGTDRRLGAFRWQVSTSSAITMDSIFAPGDVSGDGSIVVAQTYGDQTSTFACTWTLADHTVPISSISTSVARAISADGSVVVGDEARQAFRWTNSGGLVLLGYLEDGTSKFSGATGVSADGSVTIGESRANGNRKGFRWTSSEGMQSLGEYPVQATVIYPWDVSAHGDVIVGTATVINDEAFVWTKARGLRSLESVLTEDYSIDLGGWKLSAATAISDDGSVIVGYGRNPQNKYAPFKAVIKKVTSDVHDDAHGGNKFTFGVNPNPLTTNATLQFSLTTSQHVRVELCDALGNIVAVVHSGIIDAGPASLPITAVDLLQGVYCVRAVGAGGIATKQVVVVR